MSGESPSVKNNSDIRRGLPLKGIAATFAALLLLAAAFWFLMARTRAVSAGRALAGLAIKEVVHLEGFTVNLADPPGDCFLRIGIDLGLGVSITGRGEKDTSAVPTAHVRDVILRVLTTYQSNELLNPAGKLRLKQQLLEALQAAIPELAVRVVYFTDFLVQR
jgi:flagellar basal body-associated protein FliL